ncbi:hypothetical protein PtrEW7m1_012183, partial [Pyrenophora tritici-repentis]
PESDGLPELTDSNSDVDAITSDPKDKRLNRLLKSMGELKLPGDGGVAQSSQGEQQASRGKWTDYSRVSARWIHATSGATVLQGNFVGLTINSTAAARAEFAGHIAHAVIEPVKAFVPRSSLHDQIHAQLSRDATHAGVGLRATAPR